MIKPTSHVRAWFGVMAAGVAWLAAAGCGVEAGAEAESTPDDGVTTVQEAIGGTGWVTLQLINGWQSYNAAPNLPAVAKVNDIVTFRGALKAPPGTTNNTPFVLPTQFRPSNGTPNGWDTVSMKVVMSGTAQGTLTLAFDAINQTYIVKLDQDGMDGVGAAARTLTSLDGVAVDMIAVTPPAIAYIENGWNSVYGRRGQGNEPAVAIKQVGNFVRLQGALGGPGNPNNRLFNIPFAYRPTDTVFVTAALVPENLGSPLCKGIYGRINIYANGDVDIQPEYGNPNAAFDCVKSFEGVFWAQGTTGGTLLTLVNNWAPASNRSVRAFNDSGVIRLRGSVWLGTATLITTLPAGMRPATTIFVVAGAFASEHIRLVITSNGNVSVEPGTLASAQGFLSLDGVSFGI